MPAKTIEFSDSEIVKLVLEFCERRELNSSMLALERETGIVNGQFSDDLLFLRQLVLDGAWDDVVEFLQPLRGIEGFDMDSCAYHINRCKYLELLCVRTEDVLQQAALRKANSESVQSTAFRKQNERIMQDIINCLEELERFATKSDYSELCQLATLSSISEHPAYANWTPLNGRMDCFRAIMPIVEPFMRLELNGSNSALTQTARSDRLVQLIVKGILYEACIDYCQTKAIQSDENTDADSELFRIPDVLGTVHSAPIGEMDFSLVSWLEALPVAMFNQPFEQRAFELRRGTFEKPAANLHATTGNNAAWLEQICMTQSAARPRNPAASMTLPAARPTTASTSAALLLTRSFMLQHNVAADLDQVSSRVQNASLADEPAPLDNQNRDQTAYFQNVLDSMVSRSIALNGDEPLPDEALARLSTAPARQNGSSLGRSQQSDVLVISARPKTAAGSPTGSFARRPPSAAASLSLKADPRASQRDEPVVSGIQNQDTFSEYQRQRLAFQERNAESDARRAEMLRQLNPANVSINSARQQAQVAPISRESGSISARSSLSHHTAVNVASAASGLPKFIPVTVVEDQQAIRAIAWNPSGQFYVTGSNSRVLRICSYPSAVDSLRTDSLASAMPANVVHKRSKYHRGSIYCLAWNGTGELIASGSNDKAIRLLRVDARSGKPLMESELTMHDGTVRDVAFLDESASGGVTPSSLLLSAGAGDCKVYCTDCGAEGGARLARTFDGHSSQICSLFVVPNGATTFVSGASDRTARFWDVRSPEAVQIVSGGSPFASVCTDAAGRLLCAAHEDATCSLFDIRGARMLQTFKSHSDEVRSARIANIAPSASGSVGPFLLTGSYDHSVVVADLRGDLVQNLPCAVVAEHKDKVIQSRWHPSLPAFVSTSADKTAVCWCTP